MSEVVIKSVETKTGVQFRILKDDKFLFLHAIFQNYFYVKKADYIANEEEFIRIFKFCIEQSQEVGQFTKIILTNNFMRIKLRNFWEERCNTYEADIKANKRFLLDKNIKLNNTEIPFTFFDIETDDRLPMQKDERGNVVPMSRILAFSATDYKGQQIYYELNSESDADERALLTMILTYLGNYGIISGWNSEGFDMPYIKGRCEALGLNFSILDYINHLDYMDLFKKYDKKSRPSYSLNAISNEVLHESKVSQEKGMGAIYKTWLNDKDQLRKYNMEDSNLVYKINTKMMFIEVSMKRADNAGCHVRNTVNNSDSGDYLLMREYKKANIIMPSQPTLEEVEKRKAQGSIGGGHTTCFLPGFHKNVRVWDFKSEYPSVIQTWNISPETFITSLKNENTVAEVDRTKFIVTPSDFEGEYHSSRIYKKEEGVVPRVVRRLVEERDKIKYTMKDFKESNPDKFRQLYLEQYALKTDGNSIYGILSFPMSRYYSWELGDSVTTCARATLKMCYKSLQDWGCTVLGGDTDSTFVIINNHTVEELDKKFTDLLERWANTFGCVNNKLVFEYEKIFDTMLFVKKKNYAYKIKDEIHITGLEAIKSDANLLAAQLQKDFIHQVLNEQYNSEDWRLLIDKIYNKVFNQEMTLAELTLIKALTKMPKEYEGATIDGRTGKPKIKADGSIQMKSIPAHVRLAEREISQGKDIYPGSKIKFIVIKDKPILAISPQEFAKKSGTFKYKHKKLGEIENQWEGDYCASYYWFRILKPLIKVIYAYHKQVPDWNWNLTKGEFGKILANQESDEEDE